MSYVLATTEDESRNGFSMGIRHMSVLSNDSSDRSTLGSLSVSALSFVTVRCIGTSWGQAFSHGAPQEMHGLSPSVHAAPISLPNQMLLSSFAGFAFLQAEEQGASWHNRQWIISLL